MRRANFGKIALAMAVTAVAAGCQTERQPIPVMTMDQYYNLPSGQRPTIWKDPDPHLSYPYNIHENDGLSRNPDDCVRWGCIDQNDR